MSLHLQPPNSATASRKAGLDLVRLFSDAGVPFCMEEDSQDGSAEEAEDKSSSDSSQESSDESQEEEKEKRDVQHFSKKQLEKIKNDARASAVSELLGRFSVKDEAELKTMLAAKSDKAEEFEGLFNDYKAEAKGLIQSKEDENTDLKLKLEVVKAAHKSGFSDPDYAVFKYKQALSEMTDEELDSASPLKYLRSLKAKKSNAHLFTSVERKADTSNEDESAEDKKPKDGTSGEGKKSALEMSPQEWAAEKRRLLANRRSRHV